MIKHIVFVGILSVTYVFTPDSYAAAQATPPEKLVVQHIGDSISKKRKCDKVISVRRSGERREVCLVKGKSEHKNLRLILYHRKLKRVLQNRTIKSFLSDTTIEAGDIIVTEGGTYIFKGWSDLQLKPKDFYLASGKNIVNSKKHLSSIQKLADRLRRSARRKGIVAFVDVELNDLTGDE